MPVNYDPETGNKNIWKEGDYDAVLMDAKDEVSKSNNEMEVWQIGVYHPDGREQTLTEYVTAAASFKIEGLAKALGREADFKARTFHAEDYIHAGFRVYLKVEESKGDYPDKMKIAKFKAKAAPAPSNGAAARVPTSIGAAVREKIASRPAPERPFGDEQTVPDDDIPF